MKANQLLLPTAILGLSFVMTPTPVALAKPLFAADKKPLTDDYLYDTIRRKLASDQVVKGGALDLDVKEGVVTIKGTVETEHQKDRAEKVVKKITGVKSVVNQIKVAHP